MTLCLGIRQRQAGTITGLAIVAERAVAGARHSCGNVEASSSGQEAVCGEDLGLGMWRLAGRGMAEQRLRPYNPSS